MWLYIVVSAFAAYWILDRIVYRHFYEALGNCSGPKKWYPIIGTAGVSLSVKDPKDFLLFMVGLWKEYGTLMQLSFLRRLVYFISSHDNAEIVLTNNTLLEKGTSYDLFVPWIGRGLFTASGEKWKGRRKMLTPAFHFTILNEFLDIFNKNGVTLCEMLDKHVDQGPINVYPYMQLAALDNIYETAMGVSKNFQKNNDTKYVRAVKDICDVISERAMDPLQKLEFVHRLSASYRKGQDAIKVLHETTESLIAERKKEFAKTTMESSKGHVEDFGVKKRFAFLDLLLTQAASNKLSDIDIREEVDTFLFGGHDTATSALSFCTYSLAQHIDIQEKAFQEQSDIFGDSDRQPTFNDLQEMKYLEKIIKETLRLYPSAPFFERLTHQPIMLKGGVKVPANSQVTVFTYGLHRDPAVWKDPETFDPENFSPEASQNRSPYAYVPFSAGQRNCIGQKFAMVELKCTLSKIIRNFKILPSTQPEHKLYIVFEIVINSKTGHHVQLQRRK